MSLRFTKSTARTSALHGAMIGLTVSLIGSTWAQDQGNTRPVPPPPTEKPTLTPPAEPTRPVIVISERVYAGWSAHPHGAQDTTASVPLGSIHLFKDSHFKDNFASLDMITAKNAGGSNDLPAGLEDDLSSVRFNLPPGVLVILYEDAGAKGEQLALWGKGEIPAVSAMDFNDKASSWAWYYAGGGANATQEITRGLLVWPNGAVTTVATVAGDSLQLFKDKNFKGDMVPVSTLSTQAHGQLNKLPADMNDEITSLRWNLPPGMVVVFHQDGDGRKQQAAVWGQGEVADVDVWDFNDKISRWAWYYIGSPRTEVLGYTEPTPTVIITGADRDSIDLVVAALNDENELKIVENDLLAKKNATGEGTFVYSPKTRFNGVERHVIWLVVDGEAYAVTAPAKLVTPSLSMLSDAPEVVWSRSGIDRLNAEADAVKVIFKR